MALFKTNTICVVAIVTATVILMIVDPSTADKKRLCGKALSNALKIICDSNYNVMDKKSMFNDEYYNEQNFLDDEYPFQYAHMPFLNKLNAGMLIPKVRRQRHGVSDECCKKPCSYKELTSYCKEPPSE